MGDKIVITKADSKTTSKVITNKVVPKSILKTARVRPVSDAAKAPPIKKSMKKHTIRLLTEKGSRHHRKTLRKKIRKLSDNKIRQLAVKGGLLKNPDTPIGVLREIVEGGVSAGFISLD
jgi:hypothetical protein